MKTEFDKEMDSLLRRSLTGTARGDGAVRTEAEESTAHLDADELSAYAENALPASTRARYTAHLADCQRCRKIVTNISLASNVAGALAQEEPASATIKTASDTSWRTRLAALFAPRSLGYAMPLLAVCIIAVVAFIAIRGRRSDTLTARRDSSEANRQVAVNSNVESTPATTTDTANNANVTANNEQHAPSTGAHGVEDNKTAPTSAGVVGGATGSIASNEEAKSDKPKEVAQAPPVVMSPATPAPATTPSDNRFTASDAARQPPPTATGPAGGARASNTSGQVAGSANTQTTESTKSAEAEADEVARSGRTSKDKSAANRSQAEMRPDGATTARDSLTLSAPKTDARRARASNAKRERTEEPSEAPSNAESSASSETRNAAGHKFRRQGSAWIDVNYSSRMSMVNVRRGTEQFRSVIADLPELERIANQLSGEVVAVIGGRAYRIH